MLSLNILGLKKKSKKTNSLILESECWFRETLENVSLLAVILDLQGNIIFSNGFTVTLTGWNCDELLGHNWFDTLTPSEPVVKQTFLENIKQGTLPLHFEIQDSV